LNIVSYIAIGFVFGFIATVCFWDMRKSRVFTVPPSCRFERVFQYKLVVSHEESHLCGCIEERQAYAYLYSHYSGVGMDEMFKCLKDDESSTLRFQSNELKGSALDVELSPFFIKSMSYTCEEYPKTKKGEC